MDTHVAAHPTIQPPSGDPAENQADRHTDGRDHRLLGAPVADAFDIDGRDVHGVFDPAALEHIAHMLEHGEGGSEGHADGYDHLPAAQLPGEYDKPAPLGLEQADNGHSAGAPPEASHAPKVANAEKRPLSPRLFKPSRRRTLLLCGGAAAVAVVAIGVALVSPYNNIYPMPVFASNVRAMTASLGLRQQPLVAPAASLAMVTLPPAPPPPVRDPYVSPTKRQAVSEMLALQAGRPPAAAQAGAGASPATATSPTAKPAGAAAPPSGYVPAEPGASAAAAQALAPRPVTIDPALGAPSLETSLPALQAVLEPGAAAAPKPQADMTAEVLAAVAATAKPVSDAPAAPPPPVATSAPVRKQSVSHTPSAAALDEPHYNTIGDAPASSISPAEATKVVDLVTELATIVRQLKQQDAALRSDLAKRAQLFDDRLANLERRIGTYEARKAVDALHDVSETLPVTTAAPPPVAKAVPVTLASAEAVPATAAVMAAVQGKRYHVQAASPGLALLAEVDRGGDGAQIQVVVGETIPGYGRVKSIAQNGTSWAVLTEQGVIR